MNAGRRSLPHDYPSFVDPTRSIWFITICCQTRDANQLACEATANALLDSVRYRHEKNHFYVHLFLLMPDHCHALLSFRPDRKIAQTIRDWKRWTARQIGIEWQIDFFEHRLRNEESLAEKFDYIRQNPVRAGLVEKATDWPYFWMPPE